MRLNTTIKSILLAGLVLSNPFSHASEANNVQMKCKVKTNAAYAIEDGVGKKYSGIKDTFKQGDVLTLELDQKYGIFIQLKNPARPANENTILSLYINSEEVKNVIAEKERLGFNYITPNEFILVTSSFMNLKGFLGQIVLKRYYKGDWNALYVSTVPIELTTNVATLDCKQDKDKVDDWIKKVVTRTKSK
jgi:hypothetical protein